MEEYLFEAREELKRIEHIIYVSLKYTRTVDVIVNALNRMVSTYDFIIEAFLEKAKLEGKIDALPKSPALRAGKLAELYPDDAQMQKYLNFYVFLKNVLKSPQHKREEYRRHVTLVVPLENGTAELSIDSLTSCEKFLHGFFAYAWEKLIGKPSEDDM